MLGTHRKKAWASLAGGGGGGSGGDGEGKGECKQEGLDLLDRMLCYDHQAGMLVRETLRRTCIALKTAGSVCERREGKGVGNFA